MTDSTHVFVELTMREAQVLRRAAVEVEIPAGEPGKAGTVGALNRATAALDRAMAPTPPITP